MFGKLFKKIQQGSRIAEVTQILNKTYEINVTDKKSVSEIELLIILYGDSYGPHEIALKFIVDLIKRLQKGNPDILSRVKRLIKLAKAANEHGLLNSNFFLFELYDVVYEKFGIEADTI